MKVTRFVALLVAAFIVLVAPGTAYAAEDPYGGTPGAVTTSPPSPSGGGCYTTEVTVDGPAGSELSIEVTDSDDNVVYSDSGISNGDGQAFFNVELCEPGDYTVTGFDADGAVLGTSQFTVPGGGGGGQDDDGDDDNGTISGALPATGLDTRSTLALAGGAALLAVGGVTLVAARRRSA